MTSEQTMPMYLWWTNKNRTRSYFAGVAFYEEGFGEYRLKIDCYPDRKLYLKKYRTEGDEIFFRVEENRKIERKDRRFSVGDAFCDKNSHEVEIIIAPVFCARLILNFQQGEGDA